MEVQPTSFLGRMFSSDDRSADSIVFAGFLMVVTLCSGVAWDTVYNGHEFPVVSFPGGCAILLGGMGGGKKLRDMAIGGTAPQPPLPEGTKP